MVRVFSCSLERSDLVGYEVLVLNLGESCPNYKGMMPNLWVVMRRMGKRWIGRPSRKMKRSVLQHAIFSRASEFFIQLIIHIIYSTFIRGTRRYRNNRTWHHRVQRLHQNWAPRIEALADAYLHWYYPSDVPPVVEASTSPSTSDSTEDYDFVIDVFDIHTLATSTNISRSASTTITEALVLNGYLGTSPERPTLAISMKTLELFRKIRLRKASFSVESFSKVICDFYEVRHPIVLM
jgi:hypothetical protein